MGIVRQVDVDYMLLLFPAGGEQAWRRRSAFAVVRRSHPFGTIIMYMADKVHCDVSGDGGGYQWSGGGHPLRQR